MRKFSCYKKISKIYYEAGRQVDSSLGKKEDCHDASIYFKNMKRNFNSIYLI